MISRANAWLTLWIALGSLLGSVGRHAVQVTLASPDPGGSPAATLLINTLGSLAIGWLAGLKLPTHHWLSHLGWRQFLMTGVCGGFTTFSIFTLETLSLIEQGLWLAAAGNTGLTVLLMMAGVVLGYRLAQYRASKD